MIKAGAQRVAAELGLVLVDVRHEPARARASPATTRLGLRPSARASTSTRPRRPGRHAYRMERYVIERAAGARRARASRSRADRRGIFGHSMGGHGALVARAAPSGALPQRLGLRADRRAHRRCPGAEGLRAATSAPIARAGRSTTPARWCARGSFPAHAARRPGHGRQVPGDAAAPGAVRGGLRRVGTAARAAHARGLRPRYYFIATFVEEHLRHHGAALGA